MMSSVSRLKKAVIVLMITLIAVIILPSCIGTTKVEAKAKKTRLNYARVTMTEGYAVSLKVKGTKRKVKWESSNKKVATVNKKGKVKGKNIGKCTITAKVKGKKLKCKIEIKEINKRPEVSADFDEATLDVLQLKLDVNGIKYDEDGKPVFSGQNGTYQLELLNESENASWSTSNSKVAIVSSGNVTAISKGNCIITAKVGEKSYSCEVEITDLKDSDEIAKQVSIYNMLAMINKDRVKANVAPLKVKEEVNKVADLRAQELIELFSHTRPNGKNYGTAYNAVGTKVGYLIGENVAYMKDKAYFIEEFVKATYDSLYASTKHRENILNPNYEYIGISFINVACSGNDTNSTYMESYCAQEFYTK